MTVDSTLTFAARRNVPVRYNRSHLETTIQAMERIAEIRARRERQFYKNRVAGNKAARKAADRKLVEEQGHLLPRERGSERVAREERVENELVEGLENLGTVEEGRLARKEKARRRLLVGGGVEDEEMGDA
jgi:large subunit ribosomal protein L24e